MILPNPTEEMETIGLLILGFVGFVIVFGVIPLLKNALFKDDEADE